MVVASSNDTPCFRRFDLALEPSHSNSKVMRMMYHALLTSATGGLLQNGHPWRSFSPAWAEQVLLKPNVFQHLSQSIELCILLHFFERTETTAG